MIFFNDIIVYNIVYGCEGVMMVEVIEVVCVVYVYDFIVVLFEGY